jgi:DNA invertase Pin-like site-specific DNA recombinase
MTHRLARVSPKAQSVGEVKKWRAAAAENVLRETAGSTPIDRSQLRRVPPVCQKGNALIVTDLDRLARSTRDLLNLLEGIATAGSAFLLELELRCVGAALLTTPWANRAPIDLS